VNLAKTGFQYAAADLVKFKPWSYLRDCIKFH